MPSLAPDDYSPTNQPDWNSLTPGERDVAFKMAEGWSNKEIAQLLHRSEGTVKNQISSLRIRLSIRSRTRFVALWHQLDAAAKFVNWRRGPRTTPTTTVSA